MDKTVEEKASNTGEKAEVAGPDREPGKPDQPFRWRERLRGREDRLHYLQTAERYWFSKDWYGSERRKTEA